MIRYHFYPAVLAAVAAVGFAGCSRPVPGTERIVKAERVRYAENPTGLATGFWANYRRSADIVRDFGPRPLERVNFHKWSQQEKAPGEYDFANAFKWECWAHLAGSTVITNVNTFFTKKLNPDGMDAIPSFYAQDIADPVTREAAKRYLAAFVKELLETVGTAWLALDYEMIWFAMPTKPEVRQAYRDWFLESAEICRQTARNLGMAEQLKIGVIVNTDPFDTAGHSLGSPAEPVHEPQAWLMDCVKAADFLGIDTYAGGAEGVVTPEKQLRVIRFWMDHYAGDQPVYITESGFTTSAESETEAKGYHIRGTEVQQAAFFEAMFAALAASRGDRSDPVSRLRGYCIWKYADRNDEADPVERHFGLVRDDGTRKPAHRVVAAALAKLDADPVLAATMRVGADDVLRVVRAGKAVPLRVEGGMDFDALEIRVGEGVSALEIETVGKVCFLARVDGGAWITSHPDPAVAFRIPLPGGPSRIEIRVTGAKYPLETAVSTIRALVR